MLPFWITLVVLLGIIGCVTNLPAFLRLIPDSIALCFLPDAIIFFITVGFLILALLKNLAVV